MLSITSQPYLLVLTDANFSSICFPNSIGYIDSLPADVLSWDESGIICKRLKNFEIYRDKVMYCNEIAGSPFLGVEGTHIKNELDPLEELVHFSGLVLFIKFFTHYVENHVCS